MASSAAEVLVRNLPSSITIKRLRQEFAKCGPIRAVKFLMDIEDQDDSQSDEDEDLIQAVIKYETEDCVDSAVEQLNGAQIEGTRVQVERRGDGNSGSSTHLADCLICLEARKVCKYKCLLGQHSVCSECFVKFVESKIETGLPLAGPLLQCPAEECEEEIPLISVTDLVPKEVFEVFDEAVLKNYLSRSEDIVHCANPDCEERIFTSSDALDGECPSCNYRFCTNCHRTHGWVPCDEIPDEAAGATAGPVAGPLNAEERLARLDEERTGENFVRQTYKHCPECNYWIEKIDGCNTVICSRCKVTFCYGCLRRCQGNACCPIA